MRRVSLSYEGIVARVKDFSWRRKAAKAHRSVGSLRLTWSSRRRPKTDSLIVPITTLRRPRQLSAVKQWEVNSAALCAKRLHLQTVTGRHIDREGPAPLVNHPPAVKAKKPVASFSQTDQALSSTSACYELL